MLSILLLCHRIFLTNQICWSPLSCTQGSNPISKETLLQKSFRSGSEEKLVLLSKSTNLWGLFSTLKASEPNSVVGGLKWAPSPLLTQFSQPEDIIVTGNISWKLPSVHKSQEWVHALVVRWATWQMIFCCHLLDGRFLITAPNLQLTISFLLWWVGI